jgi:hypothetical protein
VHACHASFMTQKPKRARKQRAQRIRVPNQERALFQVNEARFVGVLQRLSLTGGSAVLSKGPIPHGTEGEMALNTVFGKVRARIEFLNTGAEGIPLAQGFRFVSMDGASKRRFHAAAQQMLDQGFGAEPKQSILTAPASEALGDLVHSVRRIAATLIATRSAQKSSR